MRIYLQKSASDETAMKFYHIIMQQDLLAGWTVIREWGYQGAAGRSARNHYPDRESAEAAVTNLRDQQIARGYKVVFMQGSYS